MDIADARCADHFSLTRLPEAFSHCVGRYQLCPIYQRLVNDRAVAIAASSTAATPAGRLAG